MGGLAALSNWICPRQTTARAIPIPTAVDAAKVCDWLNRFNHAFPAFQRTTQNGLYSLLKKEMQSITPLLQEGQGITASAASFPSTAHMVDQLIKPRLAILQTTYTGAGQKIAAKPKLVEGDAKLEKKWRGLGLPISILSHYADCARFLVDSKLAFVITGYKRTCGNADLHDIKLDGDGHPMIKVQGRFVRWETIARELEYDPKSERIKSRVCSNNAIQVWNYFDAQGLVPIDRFNYNKVFSIYEHVTQAQYDHLQAFSKRFYLTNPERDPGIAKDCVLQFFTTPRRHGIPDHPLFANLYRNISVHVGIRVITADRKIHSFGLEKFARSNCFSTLLTTGESKITAWDFEEFREYKEGRYTTCIPLSSRCAQSILAFVDELNSKQIRFQLARQNCLSVMQEVMQRGGCSSVDVRTTGYAVLASSLPYLSQFPVIGGLIGKVERCAKRLWDTLPQFIAKPLSFAKSVIFYIPEKCGTILVNLLMLKMGAAKMTKPLPAGSQDEELYNKKGIQSFSRVIRSWTGIFKNETSAVNHSKLFIDWQKKQESTFFETGGHGPKLAFLPPPVVV